MSHLETEHDYKPPGYCPRCDYPTHAGTCPECGGQIAASDIRKSPRGAIRRRTRKIVVALILVVGTVLFAGSRHEFIPYFPTFYLLRLQVMNGPVSAKARQELAKRFTNGTMNPTQVSKFVRQWCDVRWRGECASGSSRILITNAGNRGRTAPQVRLTYPLPASIIALNDFVNRGFPLGSNLPLFAWEEKIRAIQVSMERTDSQSSSKESTYVQLDRGDHWIPASSGVLSLLSKPGNPGTLTRQAGFYGSTLMITPDCGTGRYRFRVDTTVVVTDLGTNTVIATWPLTHEFDAEIQSPPSDEPWTKPGIEDLLFPYGKMPGEFSISDEIRKRFRGPGA